MSEFPDEIEDDLGMCGLSYEQSRKLHAQLRKEPMVSKLDYDTHPMQTTGEGFFEGYGDLMCAFLAGVLVSALLIALIGG